MTGLLRCLPRIAVALALWLSLAGAAWACPGCKEALAAQEGGGNLVQGYFWSILFMMSMPFAILGTFGTSMYVAVRRARTSQQAASQQTAPGHAAHRASSPLDESAELEPAGELVEV